MSIQDISFSTLLLVATVGLLSWAAWAVVYRLFFHPLASFPGPRFAALTYCYEYYFDLCCNGYTFKLKELHHKYGPVIRLNPDELHFNDPDFFDEIFNNSNGVAHKPPNVANVFGPFPATIGTADHHLHRLRRSALNPFFSRRSVADLIPFFQLNIERLSERFEEASKTGEPLNLKYVYAALTVDNITEYCFSRCDDHVLKPDFNRQFFDNIDSFMEVSLLNKHFPWIFMPIFTLPDAIARRLNSAMADTFNVREQLGEQVEAIRAGHEQSHETSGHPTIFHDLLSADLPPAEMSPRRLRDEAFSVVTAGSITVAFTIRSLTYHVMANPQVRRRLLDELRTVMPHRSDHPKLGQLENLPYLTAVIQEGLRMTHAVTHRTTRVHPEKAFVFKDKVIPPGTVLNMTPLLIHENEDIFPDPYEFRPERWLLGKQQNLQRYLFAFGRGTRSCLGLNLAWAELYVVLACIFRRFEFDISKIKRERDIDSVRDVITAGHAIDSPGIIVTVKHVE